jgi:hypothetical protein
MPNNVARSSFSRITLGLFFCTLVMLTSCVSKTAPKILRYFPERGNVDTEVTIEGKGFNSAPSENTIKLGDTVVPNANITLATTTKIKAKVPAGATTGLISISTTEGTDYSKKEFVVDVVPETSDEWTFMVYLDADNNLERAGIEDFLEMADVGSQAGVNIVVQMDRVPGFDESYDNWTGTRRFLIKSGDIPSISPIQDLGEANMGDPDILQKFVEWSAANYPAKHYALTIWNHGGGWRDIRSRMLDMSRSVGIRGDADVGVSRAIAWDDTDGDKLYMKEVQLALEAAGVKLDIVGFDACLMGMVEVAYAMRNVADYVVGSEDLEPGDGWPYDKILAELVAIPSLSPRSLSALIVTKYFNSYPHRSGITQASVEVSKLNKLCSKIDDFVSKANNDWASIKTARMNTQDYHESGQSYWGVDLWDFADKVHGQVASNDIKNASIELKNAIDDFVVREYHSSDVAGSHGIAIYFPPTQSEFYNDYDHTGYEEDNTFMPVDFVKDYDWDNWLKEYYSK